MSVMFPEPFPCEDRPQDLGPDSVSAEPVREYPDDGSLFDLPKNARRTSPF